MLSLGVVGGLTSCKKEHGCTDPAAMNYDAGADEDCCCAYETPPTNDNTVVLINPTVIKQD